MQKVKYQIQAHIVPVWKVLLFVFLREFYYLSVAVICTGFNICSKLC